MKKVDHDITTDTLIIGGGVAGLTTALKIAERQKVVLLSKGSLKNANSYYAQGGIATVLSDEDSFEKHICDTLTAGAGLCKKEVVELIVKGGPKAINELINLGVAFTMEQNSDFYHLTKEGGHSERRVIHSDDVTGKVIMEALLSRVKESKNITVLENQFAIDLMTSDKNFPDFTVNRCLGAYVLNTLNDSIYKIKAARTIVATGGHGKVYLYTSNPDSATGDGLAMAWRAGCKVANLEFMQFHPTCLFHPDAKTFLISEAVRGEGGILRNSKGEDFTKNYHEMGSLAPRDIVARAIDSELKKSGEHFIYLDVKEVGLEKFKQYFPNIYQKCQLHGIDISHDLIPVVPAAHYSCGGIVVDQKGRTGIGGLYAIGEVACTGVHGANRLASNSLLEALVFADRVSEVSLADGLELTAIDLPDWDPGKAVPPDEQVVLMHTWDELRRLMWNYVGIVRTDKRLRRAYSRIQSIRSELEDYYWNYQINEKLLEVRNLAEVAYLTVKCAMKRKESRGIHYNLDFPFKLEISKDTIVG